MMAMPVPQRSREDSFIGLSPRKFSSISFSHAIGFCLTALLNKFRQRSNRRILKKTDQRDFRLDALVQLPMHLHNLQGMCAYVEEIIIHTNLLDAEHVPEYSGNGLLQAG